MDSLDPPLPDVVDWPFAGPQACAKARSDPAARRLLLSSYKFYVVRPAMLKLDLPAFQKAAAASLPVFRLPFSAWLSRPPGLQWNLLDLALDSGGSFTSCLFMFDGPDCLFQSQSLQVKRNNNNSKSPGVRNKF